MAHGGSSGYKRNGSSSGVGDAIGPLRARHFLEAAQSRTGSSTYERDRGGGAAGGGGATGAGISARVRARVTKPIGELASLLSDSIALQSPKGFYFVPRNHRHEGECRMDARILTDNEVLDVIKLGGDKIALRTSEGFYISAERKSMGYTVRAVVDEWIGKWEEFVVERHGQALAFRSENGYLSAKDGGGGALSCAAQRPTEYEMMTPVNVLPGRVYTFPLRPGNPELVWVRNKSRSTIYVKDEDSSRVCAVYPGEIFKGSCDGIAFNPGYRRGEAVGRVLKFATPCGRQVIVSDDKISLNCNTKGSYFLFPESMHIPFAGEIIDALHGGWKTRGQLDGTWDNLFKASRGEHIDPDACRGLVSVGGGISSSSSRDEDSYRHERTDRPPSGDHDGRREIGRTVTNIGGSEGGCVHYDDGTKECSDDAPNP